MHINCHSLLPRSIQSIPYELQQVTIQFTCLVFSKYLNKFHSYIMTANRTLLPPHARQTNIYCLWIIKFISWVFCFLVSFQPSSKLSVKPLNSHFIVPNARRFFPYFLCIIILLIFTPVTIAFCPNSIISENAQSRPFGYHVPDGTSFIVCT